MKKLLILLILLGAAGGAGFFYSQEQSKKIEAQIAPRIAAFNAEVKKQTGVTPLEYKVVQLSGFPFATTLTLQNPTIRIPVTAWAEQSQSNINWVEEHAFEGDVVLSIDWKVTHFTVAFPVARRSASYINQKKAFERIATTSTPTRCSLTLNLAEAIENVWQPMKVLQNLPHHLSLIKKTECRLHDYKLIAASDPRIVYQSLENLDSSLQFDQSDSSNTQSIFDISLNKFQAFPASDQYYKTLLIALPKLANTLQNEYIAPHSLALLGQQNLSLHGDYTGNGWPKTMLENSKLSLPQIQWKNALFNTQGRLALQNQPQEDKQRIDFDVDLQGSFSAAAEALVHRVLTNRFYYRPAAIGVTGFHVSTAYLPPSQLGVFVADITPKFSQSNPHQLAAKGSALITPTTTADSVIPAQTQLSLEKIVLNNKDWKLGIAGNGSYAPARFFPVIDAKIAVEKGDVFYEQLEAKLIQMEQWRQVQRPAPVTLITPDFLVDLKRFIDALARGKNENLAAEVPSLGNPIFHLQLENFLPKINGLDVNKVMTLYNEMLMTHFENNAPASIQHAPVYHTAPRGVQ